MPLWSRDGRELLFHGLDGRLMAAGYTATGDSFAVGKPRVGTEARIRSYYDIAPDGKRLAAIIDDEASSEKLPHT